MDKKMNRLLRTLATRIMNFESQLAIAEVYDPSYISHLSLNMRKYTNAERIVFRHINQ